jgi:hypothetical protein
MAKVYDNEKWGVHVIGPDSLMAAESFEEANDRAHQINTSLSKEENDDIMVYAYLFLWDEQQFGLHAPEETDWSDIG